jgi:EmrB/QacA subfamily drug resistance transporter
MDRTTKRLITAGLMVSLLVTALDQTIVDTAIPRMIAELHGEAIFTWVITIYMLASSVILPVVGKLADLYGRKILFLTGMGVFLAGSVLSGLAGDMVSLIIFRGVQGLGAGMLMPVVFTMVGDVYPGAQRAKVQGFFAAVYGLGSIVGPKLGGYITFHFSWRWVFFINLPVGIIAAVMMFLFYLEAKGERRSIDWLGSITITAGLTCLLLAITSGGGAWSWNSPLSFALMAGAVVLLGAFLLIETRAKEPVLDLNLFRNRTFSLVSMLAFLTGAAMFGVLVFVPWFVQGVVGLDPNQAGNVMVPAMISMVVFSMIGGPAALKLPYREVIGAGLVLMLTGFVLATRWTAHTSELVVMLDAVIVGAGLGIIAPILTLAVQNAFPATRRGVVTSARTFFNQLGATVGVAIFGLIFNQQMAEQFTQRFVPLLPALKEQLPAGGQDFLTHAVAEPQLLIRVLLREDVRDFIPLAIRPQVIEVTKEMMTTSLLAVFWCAIALVILGGGVCLLFGRTSLKRQSSEMALSEETAAMTQEQERGATIFGSSTEKLPQEAGG